MNNKEIITATHLDKFIDNIEDPTMLFNSNEELLYFNTAAKEFFGITSSSVTEEAGYLVKNLLSRKLEYVEEECKRNKQVFIRKAKKLHFDVQTLIFETIETEKEQTKKIQSIYSEEVKTIVDTINDGIYISDGKGFTLLVNNKYSEMTGIRQQEVQGRHISELVYEGYFDSSVTWEVLKKKSKVSVLQKIKEQEKIWLVNGNPFKGSDNKVKMVINSVYDMTELNRLREELKQQEMINNYQKKELDLLRSKVNDIPHLIGSSKEMKEIKKRIAKVADIDSTVLIVGETGSGKNVAADAIHDLSPRRSHPFIEVNCGAIPEHLIEAELFGYTEGSFTGASKGGKIGLIESAHKGTIFLDEIGELPLSLQVKILTFLQDKKIRRIGEVKYRDVDVRVIAATNRNLSELVKEKQFREDLYYRLSVIPIMMPALREHKEDIRLLAEHFLQKYNNQYNQDVLISKGAYYYLEKYHWPGNARELQHLIEQLVVLSDKQLIEADDLPEHIKYNAIRDDSRQESLQEILDSVEKEIIQNKWGELQSMTLVAKSLKIHRSTLLRKMKKLNIEIH